MERLTAILFSIFVVPGDLSAGGDLGVETAISILETSLNKRDRITAVAALRNAEEKAAPATAVLGRIIATDPTGDEAGYASEALGHIGRPSIPVIAALVFNGFDHSYVCATRAIQRLPRELEPELLAALKPPISIRPTPYPFNTILALRWYSLSPEAANRITQDQLDNGYHGCPVN